MDEANLLLSGRKSMSKSKPKVTINCVASAKDGPAEQTIEFSFPNGEGGLINFRTLNNGTNLVDVCWQDKGIKVLVGNQEGA
jgi:hypothetical protein